MACLVHSAVSLLYTVQSGPSPGQFARRFSDLRLVRSDVNALINNVSEVAAFSSWLSGGELGAEFGHRWVDGCGQGGRTPCNPGAHCSPPHF